MAQMLRFLRCLKAKVPGAVTALFPLRRRSSKIFTGSAPINCTQEATMVQVRIFFFTFEGLSIVCLLFYQRFDAALLLWSSVVGLESWVAMFHSRRCSYIRADDPSTKTGIHCELEHRGLRSQQFCERCAYFFFHQAPPSAVSSPSQSSPSFPSHSLSTRRNQLSPRSPSSRKPSNVQIVPAYVASGNIHNAVSRHLDKNRAKLRRTVFSMNKAQESKQRSTNWRWRHLGDMQQQPRRWPDYDKCEETKLR